MSTPRQQLEHIMRTAQNLHESWSRFAETNGDLASTAADRLGVQGGDHCDPVYAGVLGNEKFREVTAAISEALGSLLEAETKVTGVNRQHPATVRTVDAAKRQALCADPLCDELVVDRRTGLCFQHWQKRTA